jgi:hypothetical protein
VVGNIGRKLHGRCCQVEVGCYTVFADVHVCGDRASVTREKIVIKFTADRAEHEQQVCRKHGAIVMCYSSDPNSVG